MSHHSRSIAGLHRLDDHISSIHDQKRVDQEIIVGTELGLYPAIVQ